MRMRPAKYVKHAFQNDKIILINNTQVINWPSMCQGHGWQTKGPKLDTRQGSGPRAYLILPVPSWVAHVDCGAWAGRQHH